MLFKTFSNHQISSIGYKLVDMNQKRDAFVFFVAALYNLL